jgi:predicted secreted protein
VILAVGLAATPVANWTGADDGKTATLKVGDRATLTLTASGGTGYLWKIDPVDAAVLAVGDAKTVADNTPGLVGGPVQTVWTIDAKGAGKADLIAKLVRPWMANQPAQTVTIHVEVK